MLENGIPIEFEDWVTSGKGDIPIGVAAAYQQQERPVDLYAQYGGDYPIELEYTWEVELARRNQTNNNSDNLKQEQYDDHNQGASSNPEKG